MLPIRVLKEFDESLHARDSRGRFTFTQADLDRMGPNERREFAKRIGLNVPTGATRYEIHRALEKIALSRPSPVYKAYVSQAQRNLMEACRADPGFSDKCPPGEVTEEYHEASRGKMKDKDLPEKVEEKEKKKSRKVFIQM
jgi:hypothetical protein